MSSRIDLIGQNGNTGEHYDTEVDIVEQHWKYVRDVIESCYAHSDFVTMKKEKLIEVIGFHYKSAMNHGIKHAREERL